MLINNTSMSMKIPRLLSSSISHLLPSLKSAARCKCSAPNLTPSINHDASVTLIIQDQGSMGTFLFAHHLPCPENNHHPTASSSPSSTTWTHLVKKYAVQTYLGFLGVRSVKIEASFKDLLLVSVVNPEYKYSYYICDPLTRRFIGVPRLESLLSNYAGFVFDGSRYRVVELVPSRTELGGVEICIYSSESGEWRRYRMGRGGGIDHLSGTPSTLFAYNGKLHWLTRSSDDSTSVTAIDPFLDPPPESCYYDAEYVVLSRDGDLLLSPYHPFSYTFGVSRGRLQLIVASGGALRVWEIEEDYTACHLKHEVAKEFKDSTPNVLALHPYNPNVIILQFFYGIEELNIQTLVSDNIEIVIKEEKVFPFGGRAEVPVRANFAGRARYFPLVKLSQPTLHEGILLGR